MKEFIGTGKTIEEATQAAKIGLNAPQEAYDNGDVKIEIVAMPKKKTLGLFGGSDAKVKASYEEKTAPAKKQSKPRKQHGEKKPVQKASKQNEPAKPVQEVKKPESKTTGVSGDDLTFISEYIKSITTGLKIADASVNAKFVEDYIEAEIVCDDYGIIIGHRGETLDAIQCLATLALKNKTGKYARVSINVGDYRARREETLRSLARKNANYSLRTGRRYTFEPMNPYERRIIHTTIQEIDGVTSRSVGTGQARRVVIEPEGGVRYSNNRRKGGYSGNASRSNSSAPSQAPAREKLVDRADMPKFGKIEVNKD